MQKSVQTSPETSPKNQAPAPKFRLYSDGFGTLLGIAADTIERWERSGSLTPDDTAVLQEQINAANINTGEALALLAASRAEYCMTSDNSAICAALMTASRLLQETARIGFTLQYARERHAREQSGQPARTMQDLINQGV
jgi:hypothetical protein